MASQVLGRVLTLAEIKILKLGHDPRSLSTGTLAMGGRVIHTHHHGMRDLARPWRSAVASDIADDYRSLAECQLRAMVLADSSALGETEDSGEPFDRLADIRVDEDWDHGRPRDRAVDLHGQPKLKRSGKRATSRTKQSEHAAASLIFDGIEAAIAHLVDEKKTRLLWLC